MSNPFWIQGWDVIMGSPILTFPKKKWKVVGTDNFARETVSDFLAAESINSEATAKLIADALNEAYGGRDAPVFYRAVSQDYKLYRWEP